MRRTIFALCGIFLAGTLGAPVAAQTSPATFLFLLENNGSPIGAIHAFTLNSSTGALSEAPGSPYNAGFAPQQLAVDPTGRFLYVTNQTSQDITGYSVDSSSGALTPLPGSPFFIGANPVVTGLDPTGRFLYVFAGTTTGNGISQESLFEYTIDNASGALTLSSSSPTVWEPRPGDLITSIAFNPAGNLAYLGQTPSGANSGAILICSVDFTTGNLTQIASAKPASAESDHLGVTPAGNFMYSTSRPNQFVDAFVVGATGQMIEVSGSPYPVGNTPAAILVHPSGNFVYVVNENQPYQTNVSASQYAGSISAFGVNAATGALAPISGSPFPAGINSSSIGVDPSGKFAYVAATTYTPGTFKGFAQILGFSVDPTVGALTPFLAPAWTDSVQGIGTQLTIAGDPSGAPNPAPAISSLLPSSVAAGGPAFTLQINGTGFVQGCRAYFAGQPRVTTFVSSTQLNVSILATDINNGGIAVVFVFNPLPGGGASSSLPFTITSAIPTVTTLTPTTVIAGSASLTISVMGSNFLTSSTVNFNGVAVPTIYISSTFLRGQVPPVNYPSPGSVTVTVTNPPNGSFPGGTSNGLAFSIVAPPPKFALTGISPLSTQAGGPAFTLTVTGTGFVSGAVVSFNLVNEPTTFVSSTQLTAAIPGSALAIAGNPYVIVTNADGTQSTALTFTINNPAPGGGSVSPPSLPVASSALTLKVTGTGFVPPGPNGPGSTIYVNGSPRVTTYVSSTLLEAILLPSDLSQGGTLNITIMTPPPGGGTSPAVPITVTNPVLGAITISPAAVLVNNATLLLTVKGAGFNTASTVSVNGNTRVTAFQDSGTLVTTLQAGDVAQAGTLAVAVMNPPPGGGTSPPAFLTVANPVPNAISLSPGSLVTGSRPGVLTVTGTSFVETSSVLLNSSSRTPTSVTSTSLQVALLPADLSQAGTMNITVVNPSPGGGISAVLHLVVEQDQDRLSLVSSNSPVTAGNPATFTLTYTSTSGTIPSPVNFVVSSIAPHIADAAASFQPSATMPGGASPVSVTLLVKTQSRSSASPVRLPMALPPASLELCLLTLALSAIGLRLRQIRAGLTPLTPYFLVIALLCIAGALTSCAAVGSGPSSGSNSGAGSPTGSSTGTQAGTYTIVVTATSAGVAHTVPVTLTVM